MAGTPSIKVLLGYPTKWGNKEVTIVDRSGPASYLNIGTSSHAGDVFLASDVGMGGFDSVGFMVLGGYSQTGNYILKRFTSASGTTPSASAVVGGAALTKIVFQWFTTSAAFGAISTEVTDTTDLSAEIVRLEIIGE